ncbi:MAG: hypothetical protein WCA35_14875 [Kovacikia sp.]
MTCLIRFVYRVEKPIGECIDYLRQVHDRIWTNRWRDHVTLVAEKCRE